MSKKEKKVRIFSALEVADICGVVNQTAINWIKNGFLKAFMTPGGQYRVYAEDLLTFLTSRGMRIPEDLLENGESAADWRRILIVDDDENINTLLKRFLARRLPAFTIMQAFDGFEAGTPDLGVEARRDPPGYQSSGDRRAQAVQADQG